MKKHSATKLHISRSLEQNEYIEVDRLIQHAGERKLKYMTEWKKEYFMVSTIEARCLIFYRVFSVSNNGYGDVKNIQLLNYTSGNLLNTP